MKRVIVDSVRKLRERKRKEEKMDITTPECKKLNPGYKVRYQVIVTNSSGEVVLVTRQYASESTALKRAEKETANSEVPAKFATLLAYNPEGW